jgi:hypothetical protein
LGARHHVGSSEWLTKLKRGSEGDYVNDKAIDLEDFEPARMTQEEPIEKPSCGYRTDARSASDFTQRRPRALRGISEGVSRKGGDR